MERQQEIRRDKVLSEMGLRVVRFRNEEAERGLSAVLGKISRFIENNSQRN